MRRSIALVSVLSLLPFGASASAGWLNELCRDRGLGWSDGYHAYEGCPDSRHHSQPWQRRSQRGTYSAEPLVPYLAPESPAESLPAPKGPRTLVRGSDLQVSRPK